MPDSDWNVFSHMDSEPSPVVPHQYWMTDRTPEAKKTLPINEEYEKLIQLSEHAVKSTDLATKLGRSEEDLLGLLKEAHDRNQDVYISMSKWV